MIRAQNDSVVFSNERVVVSPIFVFYNFYTSLTRSALVWMEILSPILHLPIRSKMEVFGRLILTVLLDRVPFSLGLSCA